jgi:hypothetical protein
MPITLTPEQTFGFGSVPLTSYFKPPAGGSRNTQFSPQARAMLQQDEVYQQQQRQMEADQLVNDLLGQAPELSDEQINQTLIENPNIFRGRGAEAIQGYQQFRQQAATPADQKLGTYFYTKIQEDKDPRHLQNFQRRMLDEGMSANDAWEAYRTDQFNEPLMQQLAEAGVPREQFSQYMTDTGHFDPVEVSRGIAQTKAAAKASGLGKKAAEPIDEEIELLKDAMEQRKKRLEAVGGNITEDPVFKDYADSLDKAYGQKRTALRPPPPPVDDLLNKYAAGSQETPASPTRPVSPQRVALEQEEAYKKENAGREQRVADAEWTKNKINLGQTIGKAFPGKDEVLGIALDIAEGLSIPKKVASMGANYLPQETTAEVPLENIIADKLGVNPNDVAFEEPGNVRTGSQKVTYAELIREWAKEAKALYEAGFTTGGQKPQQTSNLNNPVTAGDQEMAKLLDTYAPKK